MKFCENCGNELNEKADVCTKCGKSINKKDNTKKRKGKKSGLLLVLFY